MPCGMHRLISLSPSVAGEFHRLNRRQDRPWFAASDPVGRKVGSGGGSLHLLREAWRAGNTGLPLREWLHRERGLILHAGGQSRRLPAYAAESKALLPVPVFRWSRGQALDQTLLDLQLPFLEKVLEAAPGPGYWVIASGDVYLRARTLPATLPASDVIALGLWGDPDQATRHGVFFTPRNRPEELAFMLQKPDLERLRSACLDHYFLLDVGVWVLSARAIEAMLEAALPGQDPEQAAITDFDLYGTFGTALGAQPSRPDERIRGLTTHLVPLDGGEFYHFGSCHDLILSTLQLQNRVNDQRKMSSPDIKPHPSLFVQNSVLPKEFLQETNSSIWIENCHLPTTWRVSRKHVLTGIPDNTVAINLPEGICIEVVPLRQGGSALRVYGFDDAFRGAVGDAATTYCQRPFTDWLTERHLQLSDLQIEPSTDLQDAPIFPVFAGPLPADLLGWLVEGKPAAGRESYLQARRVSANAIADQADLLTVQSRRHANRVASLPVLARNAHRSVFYQLDLEQLSLMAAPTGFEMPAQRPDRHTHLFHFVHDAMFRAQLARQRKADHTAEEARAFGALRDAMIDRASQNPVRPRLHCLDDQIIWARSPIRLDLAGGWTDTPPFCFLNGGRVVNLAAELNGQPPIQVFIRPRPEGGIKLRSIDLGISIELTAYDDLRSYAAIGSGFAIPKAALALCGFLPEFHQGDCPASLQDLLRDFGAGIEISLLCAVPKGSGLGTSSILAATVLGALSEFCHLGWDIYTIAERVLILEQMLTSGGGWQDQYGGICRGLKYLETTAGLAQTPRIRWLDDFLFTDPSIQPNILLYYTGITRTAKNVLAEIVRGMFLNSGPRLGILGKIGENAVSLQESIQAGDYDCLCRAVQLSWELNQALDSGTNTPEIAALLDGIAPWLAGGKLLGAGGGGYLLLLAKDSSCAQKIKETLLKSPPNARARFVAMSLSKTGLQVTRS